MGTLEELIGVVCCADTRDVNVTFIVEDTTELNNSVVHLSPVTMEDLNIWYGVAILLEGNKNRKAVCTALTDENCGENKIRMNKVVRNKFGVSLGDSVSVGSFLEIPKGRKIVVRPIREGGQNCDFVQENLFESYLRPYFFGANRPVNNGDVFAVKGRARTIQFKVIKTLPLPFCIVGPSTIINCEEQKAANKRRKNEAGAAFKKVKGPQISSQPYATPPVRNSDGIHEKHADALREPTADALPEQTADALREQTADALPEQTADALREQTADALPEQTADALPEQTADALREQTAHELPEQHADALPEQNADALREQTADALSEQNADVLPEQNPVALPETNTNKLLVENGKTSPAHQIENEKIRLGKAIKVSIANEPATLEDKIKLAYSLRNQGELKRAARAFANVMTTQNEKLAKDHPDMLPIKEALATTLFDLKEYDQLAQLFLEDRQLKDIRGRAFLDTKFLFVMVLTSKNKYVDACGVLYGVIEHIRSLNLSAVPTWKTKVVYASVLYGKNKLDHALEELLGYNTVPSPRSKDKETFIYALKRLNHLTFMNPMKLHSSDPNYPDALIIKYHIGWFYYKLEDYFLATKTLQEILPLMKETMGSDHLCSKLADDLLKVCKEQWLDERE